MTVAECYDKFGGDYEGTIDRLATESPVRKYLVRFLDDPCYGELVDHFSKHEDKEAFQAVHTMKGLCLNLGLTRLTTSSSALTEALRNGRKPEADQLLEYVTRDYDEICDAIRGLEDE